MDFIESIWNKARNNTKKIVLPETDDPRILKAAELILKSKIASIVLLGKEEAINKLARANNADISAAEIIDPATNDKLEQYCELYLSNLKARKKDGKPEEIKKLLSMDYPYFGGIMVAAGDADGMVSGAQNTTGHTIKAAIYTVGLAKDVSILSSFFVMVHPNIAFGSSGIMFYADCGVFPDPDEKQLCEIALSTADSFRKLMGKEPKIAMLSFSTKGSADTPSTRKVAKATQLALDKNPELIIDGELQFDAATIPSIAKKKAPESKVAGKANVFIFPSLEAGNIAYKITERLGGAMALGPLFQGCAKPINDLSRGCSVDDIVNVTAITAVQSQ